MNASNGHDTGVTHADLVRVHQRIDEHQVELFGKGEYLGLRAEVKALKESIQRAARGGSIWLALIAIAMVAMALKSYGVVP